MGRDDHTVVSNVEEPISGFDRDSFTCEVAPDVIAMLEDADATGAVDPARHRLGTWRWFFLDPRRLRR
jgi:hypothetical protein